MGIFDRIRSAIFGLAKATEAAAPISQIDVEAVLTDLARRRSRSWIGESRSST